MLVTDCRSRGAAVWRSDRDPGTSELLASAPGQGVLRSLQVVGDSLYFLVNVGSPFTGGQQREQQIYRVPADAQRARRATRDPLLGLSCC